MMVATVRMMAVASSLILAFAARADQIIDVEGADDTVEAAGADSDAAAADKLEDERERSAAKERASTRESPAGGAGRGTFYGSGGIWPGAGFFSCVVTVGYAVNPYVAVETTGHYLRYDRDRDTREEYGPEVDLVLRGVNPTIVTPYVGAGPGYSKWRRATAGDMFSDGQTGTANAFGGLAIALTRHFGLSAQRRLRVLVEDQPRTFADHEQREPKETISNEIGFQVVF